MKRFLIISLFALLGITGMGQGIDSSWSLKKDSTGLKQRIEIDSFRLKVIPPSLGVQFYKDGIIFLSMTKNERKMASSHISFGAVEAYHATILDTVPGLHKIFSESVSFSFPCDAMTFSKDYQTVFFTQIAKDKKEKIFMAKLSSKDKGKTEIIREMRPLDFCNENSSYSHPALSSDEKMMIFASDRVGSAGGMDLFLSRLVNNKWSAPENLGKRINTAGNEFFPFLDSENNLFFSSDKLPGFGGYDVFTSKFNGTSWDRPVNLTDFVNTAGDEMAFTISKTDGKTALFTRRSGGVNMQLFKISVKPAYRTQNLITIFNNPAAEEVIVSSKSVSEVSPDAVKTEKTNSTTTPSATKKIPGKTVSKAVPGNKTADNKVVTIKPTAPITAAQKDKVFYRIQILASPTVKKEKEIILEGKSYKLYEYFYLGAYRYSIGEFTTLKPAIELQRVCRQSSYPNAFVAAFKNNTRTLDLNLFK